jgi:hypothetical protein
VKVGATADKVIAGELVGVVADSVEEFGVGVGVVNVVVVGGVVVVLLLSFLFLFLLLLFLFLLLLLSKMARQASACTRLRFGSRLVLFLGDKLLLSVVAFRAEALLQLPRVASSSIQTASTPEPTQRPLCFRLPVS